MLAGDVNCANEPMSQLQDQFQRRGCHEHKDPARRNEALGAFPKNCQHVHLKADTV